MSKVSSVYAGVKLMYPFKIAIFVAVFLKRCARPVTSSSKYEWKAMDTSFHNHRADCQLQGSASSDFILSKPLYMRRCRAFPLR